METQFNPGQKLANYSVLSALGAGGMGVVYRARDERLGRDVALKVLPSAMVSDANARARMLREAQTASSLNHPHICHIYEIGEAAGHSYIAMELVEGKQLSASIPAGGMPIDLVIRYGEQMADALDHAHSRNVLHRDIKSSNVVITPEGRVKILDFGLAKRISEEIASEATLSQVSPLTQAGSIAGTLSYLAPEVLSGHPADARSDLWALGVVLYEMSSGRLPFQGRTSFEVSSSILRESAKPLPARVPPGLRAVILRGLAKEPTQRYQRSSEMRAALEAIGSGSSPALVGVAGAGKAEPVSHTSVLESTHALPSILHPRKSARSRVWFYVGLIAALTALGVGVDFILKWQKSTVLGTALPTPPGSDASSKAAPPPPALPMGRLTGGGKPSANNDANAYFEKSVLFGRSHFDLPKSREMLEKALELDPKFSEARSAHALNNLLFVDSGLSNDSVWIYKAEQEAQRTTKEDPECAAAHSVLAAVYVYQGRNEAARAEAQEAFRRDSNHIGAYAWMGVAEYMRGNYPEAMRLIRAGIERNQTFVGGHWILGQLLHETGDLGGGVRELGSTLEWAPDNPPILSDLAHFHIESGDLATARTFYNKIPAKGRSSFRARLTLALLLAREGKRRDALREMDAGLKKYAEVNPRITLQVVEFYSILGDEPEALAWLERAVRSGDERVSWFKTDPLLENVRKNPRFQQIIDSIESRRRGS